MMRVLRGLFVLVVLLICCSHAFARIEIEFQADFSSWYSDYIVVVETVDLKQSRFRVIESWKGDLPPNTVISIPFFGKAIDKFDLKIYNNNNEYPGESDQDLQDQHLSEVTNSRMVFFLKSSKNNYNTKIKEFEEGYTFNSSTVWLENGLAHAFLYYSRTGECRILPLGLSEAQFKNSVMVDVNNHLSFVKICDLPDRNKKIEQLIPYLKSEKYFIFLNTLRELEDCQETALPTLWNLLNDESLGKRHADFIVAIGEIKNNDKGVKLTSMISQELVFWQSIAPQLKIGWWNGEGLEEHQKEEYQNRYSKLLRILEVLENMEYANCRSVVIELRDFWRSQPALEDITGLDQMSQTCDRLLDKLSESKKQKAHSDN